MNVKIWAPLIQPHVHVIVFHQTMVATDVRLLHVIYQIQLIVTQIQVHRVWLAIIFMLHVHKSVAVVLSQLCRQQLLPQQLFQQGKYF